MAHKRRNNFFVPGEKIRGMRLAINMTSLQMARLVGVSRVTYSGWENSKGRPSFSQFMTICDVCGIKGLNLFMASLDSIANVYLDSDRLAAAEQQTRQHSLLKPHCGMGGAALSPANGSSRKRASAARTQKKKRCEAS